MKSERVVYKYPLGTGLTEVTWPKGSKVLSVQMQDDIPTLWALLDPNVAEKETRRFTIVGTGHVFNVTGKTFVGTVQDGSLVWHVWEDKEGAAEVNLSPAALSPQENSL